MGNDAGAEMPIYDETNIENFSSVLRDAGNPDLALDLGCGKSELCHALARLDLNTYYVGVDWNRHWCIAGEARRKKLGAKNIIFVNMEADKFLRGFIKSSSARAVYILFPSPAPKAQRLINTSFIWEVSRILCPRGELRLVTDDADYHTEIRASLGKVGWEEDFWVPLPLSLPRGTLVGTPCEEEYGSHHALRLIKI